MLKSILFNLFSDFDLFSKHQQSTLFQIKKHKKFMFFEIVKVNSKSAPFWHQ